MLIIHTHITTRIRYITHERIVLVLVFWSSTFWFDELCLCYSKLTVLQIRIHNYLFVNNVCKIRVICAMMWTSSEWAKDLRTMCSATGWGLVTQYGPPLYLPSRQKFLPAWQLKQRVRADGWESSVDDDDDDDASPPSQWTFTEMQVNLYALTCTMWVQYEYE